MKLSSFLWITIIILLVGNGIFFYLLKIRKPPVPSIESMIVSNNIASQDNHVIQQLLLYMHYDAGMLPDAVLNEVEYQNALPGEKLVKNKTSLHQLVNGEKIVFVFTLAACNSCVSEQLILLNRLGRKIGSEQILLITDMIREDMLLFMRSNEINIKLYEANMEELELFSKVQVPSVLLLTSGNQVATSFILDMDTKEYANAFYELAETKFPNKRSTQNQP